jgi:hypothetical protein
VRRAVRGANTVSTVEHTILAQMGVGFVTGICYMIAIFYAVNDLDAVRGTSTNQETESAATGAGGLTVDLSQGEEGARAAHRVEVEIYRQATGSRGGALGLLVVAFLPTLITACGCYMIKPPQVRVALKGFLNFRLI